VSKNLGNALILTTTKNRLNILHGGTIASMVDLGGSLAVASRGLFATGVSTDLNVTYLSSGGKIGDLIKAEVTCDKCEYLILGRIHVWY
jgi:acyl-coenzyme A thioesterase PaaI-like protein